jgi:hypothetical protein
MREMFAGHCRKGMDILITMHRPAKCHCLTPISYDSPRDLSDFASDGLLYRGWTPESRLCSVMQQVWGLGMWRWSSGTSRRYLLTVDYLLTFLKRALYESRP